MLTLDTECYRCGMVHSAGEPAQLQQVTSTGQGGSRESIPVTSGKRSMRQPPGPTNQCLWQTRWYKWGH